MSKKDLLPFLLFLPLIVVAVIVLLFYKKPPPEIAEYFPKNGSANISIYPKVYITFTRRLSNSETKKVDLSISPYVESSVLWSNDNKTVSLEPARSIAPDTQQTVSLKYFSKTFSWTFKTVPRGSLSEEEAGRLQQESDKAYTEEQQTVSLKYPWYEKMPMTTTGYFVAFDPAKEAFLVNLYPKGGSSIPINEQEKELKNQVLKALGDMGVKTDNYSFVWKAYIK